MLLSVGQHKTHLQKLQSQETQHKQPSISLFI